MLGHGVHRLMRVSLCFKKETWYIIDMRDHTFVSNHVQLPQRSTLAFTTNRVGCLCIWLVNPKNDDLASPIARKHNFI